MKNKERKLSKSELERREKFDKICQTMQKNGYTKIDNTISVKKANVVALFNMLPFVVIIIFAYFSVNQVKNFSFNFSWVYLWIIILIICHELIHGITWAIFAKTGFKSISFGVIWKYLTPYCTCSEPLTKFPYFIGAIMPTIILGFVLAIVAIFTASPTMLILSVFLTFGGGGDFYIIHKLLKYKSKNKKTLYYDHPYECGFVVFEKQY